MSQLVSNANAQQQASADKNAKMKKEPSAGSTRHARAAEKVRRGTEGSEGCHKLEKGTTWPKFWSAYNKRLKSGFQIACGLCFKMRAQKLRA
jgi:hypothetical protein